MEPVPRTFWRFWNIGTVYFLKLFNLVLVWTKSETINFGRIFALSQVSRIPGTSDQNSEGRFGLGVKSCIRDMCYMPFLFKNSKKSVFAKIYRITPIYPVRSLHKWKIPASWRSAPIMCPSFLCSTLSWNIRFLGGVGFCRKGRFSRIARSGDRLCRTYLSLKIVFVCALLSRPSWTCCDFWFSCYCNFKWPPFFTIFSDFSRVRWNR